MNLKSNKAANDQCCRKKSIVSEEFVQHLAFHDAFGNTFYMLKSEFYATMKFDPADGFLYNQRRPSSE